MRVAAVQPVSNLGKGWTVSRDDNRARFPEAAKVVDGFRAVFGEGVKLVWACENGQEIGRRFVGDPAKCVSVADMNLRMHEADALDRRFKQ